MHSMNNHGLEKVDGERAVIFSVVHKCIGREYCFFSPPPPKAYEIYIIYNFVTKSTVEKINDSLPFTLLWSI